VNSRNGLKNSEDNRLFLRGRVFGLRAGAFGFLVWMASHIILGLYVAVGPVLLATFLFPATRSLAERWVGSMLESGTQDCAIGLSSRMMVAAGGRARIKDCVAKSGLSQSIPAPVCDASRNGTKAVRTHHPVRPGAGVSSQYPEPSSLWSVICAMI